MKRKCLLTKRRRAKGKIECSAREHLPAYFLKALNKYYRALHAKDSQKENQRFEGGAAKAQHSWGITLTPSPKGKLL